MWTGQFSKLLAFNSFLQQQSTEMV